MARKINRLSARGLPGKKQTPKIGKGKAGPGRPKGLPNKVNALLKDALLLAAARAGGRGGLVAFLQRQAEKENNAPFLTRLGKVLPTQLAADPDDIGPPVIIIRKFSYDDAGTPVPLLAPPERLE
jgi:hypothetical protein